MIDDSRSYSPSIRTVIVDDEPLARARLRSLLKRDPDIEIIAECADGFEAIAALRATTADLLFLDIQMPEMDGFRVLEEVGLERLPVIVFVTAYDQHALRAFQVQALDYLLKPFDERRFRQMLERAKRQVNSSRSSGLQERLLALLDEWKSRSNALDRVLVKSGGRITFLRAEEIDWLKSEGNYVRLHVGASSYLLRETISQMESQLDPRRFLRIHRSAIVNLDRVQEIQQLFHGEHRVILRDGTRLTLSRTYRERLPRLAEKGTS